MNIGNLRRAAIELAALHPADRRWCLRRLPRRQALALKSLLRELRQLGPIDAELVREMGRHAPSSAALETPPPDELLMHLDRLDPSWAALALRACAHDHLELYLVHCEPDRAQVVREVYAALPRELPPALAASAARRMAASESETAPAAREAA